MTNYVSESKRIRKWWSDALSVPSDLSIADEIAIGNIYL